MLKSETALLTGKN